MSKFILSLLSDMFSTCKSKKVKRVSLVTYLTIPFLLLYLAGTVELDSFHALFHSADEHVLHSSQQEENSCHNAIYHQQKKNVCHHLSHITQLKKCPLCHVVFHSTHLSSVSFLQEPIVSAKSFKENKESDRPSTFLALRSSRGPPAHS